MAANRRLHALTARLLEHPLKGVSDLIPGYTTLYCEYDARVLTERKVRNWLNGHLQVLTAPPAGRLVDVPVSYDGEDLAEVARRSDLGVGEVVARHAGTTYHVYALGFTPGFPFMGEVDETLRLPRQRAPRPRVPAHSVAIANAQTGIYPTASPGGWNLLGRALKSVYDPHRDPPFLVVPGDRVRFQPAHGAPLPEPESYELLPAEPRHPLLKVLEPGLLDLVLDSGRFMVGRFGLSRSGPLDARSARHANAFVGNPASAPLVEFNVTGATLEALQGSVVAFAGWGMRPVLNGQELAPFASFALYRGDVLSFKPVAQGSRGYLSLAGGVESGRFMGSASVDLRGKIGRPLSAGDVLGTGLPRKVRPGFGFRPYFNAKEPVSLRLLPGPQASSHALEALSSGAFTVRRADRMGIHLEGPYVPGGDVLSEAVPLGALQVTSGGSPILLMHDRGTLGGYDKPALLHPADLPRAAQLRPGDRLRFLVSGPGPSRR